MGYALAQAALDAGAEVTLVSGPVALQAPERVKCVRVNTAEEMHDAVLAGAAVAALGGLAPEPDPVLPERLAHDTSSRTGFALGAGAVSVRFPRRAHARPLTNTPAQADRMVRIRSPVAS